VSNYLYAQEWVAAQEALKNEEMDVTYSYWDGSGHRRTIRVTKGMFCFCLFIVQWI